MTKEQQETLDKHYHHWASLRDLQFMQNLDGNVIDDIQRVHNEILPPVHYTRWCGDCVAEMVRNTYRKYDQWKVTQAEQLTTMLPGVNNADVRPSSPQIINELTGKKNDKQRTFPRK